MSRSSPSARANHQLSFDVNWQPAGLHHPRGWLQRRKQTAWPSSKKDGERQVEVPHSFPPFVLLFIITYSIVFRGADQLLQAWLGQAARWVAMHGWHRLTVGLVDARNLGVHSGGGGGGGGVSALRPLGLRAIPELRWWPGQAARRKAMLVQLHER